MTSPPAPPKHRRTSSTITSDIYTTCRALQSRLSTNLSQTPLRALRAPTLLPSPAFTPSAKPSGARKQTPEPAPRRPETPPPRGTRKRTPEPMPKCPETPPPPRGTKKRRRSISDDESRDSVAEETRNGPSTPKRQRMAPPSIPLGLSQGDFDSLERSPSTPPPRLIPSSTRSARPRLSVDSTAYPSPLVSLILEKLSLNERGWNGSESRTEGIDQRWRLLLAQAEAARGLKARREMVIRRGRRRERTSLGVLDGVW